MFRNQLIEASVAHRFHHTMKATLQPGSAEPRVPASACTRRTKEACTLRASERDPSSYESSTHRRTANHNSSGSNGLTKTLVARSAKADWRAGLDAVSITNQQGKASSIPRIIRSTDSPSISRASATSTAAARPPWATKSTVSVPLYARRSPTAVTEPRPPSCQTQWLGLVSRRCARRTGRGVYGCL